MNSLFELRKKHISSLFTNFNLQKLNDTTFQVKLDSGYSVVLILNMNFPEAPPSLSMTGFSHPILEREMIIHDKIKNWNQHFSLVSILKDINISFTRVKPIALTSSPAPVLTSVQTTAELMSKNLKELHELDSDLLAFDDFFEELEFIRKNGDKLEEVYSKNYEIASQTRKKEEEYLVKVQEYQILFSKQVELRKEFDDLWYKYQNSIMVL